MKKIFSLLLIIIIFASGFICPEAVSSENNQRGIEIENISRRCYRVFATVDDDCASDCTFVAASYDIGNILIGVERQNATVSHSGAETIVSACFDLSEKAYAKDTNYTKFFLWDMDCAVPLVDAVTKNYESVEIARGKTAGGNSVRTGVGYDMRELVPSRLTDGQETDGTPNSSHNKGAGFYYTPNTGYLYVDLGRPYVIDRIEVVAYMPISWYRSSNYDIIVTNTLPDLNPYEADNPGSDVLVAHIGEEPLALDNVRGKKNHYVPGGTEAKRYVSFEKFGLTDGLLIQEVRVYVLEEDMPEQSGDFVEVAQDKVSGGGLMVYPTGRLVDGDKSSVSGFYHSKTMGNMYIDLGVPYRIDHIDILAYNGNYLERAGDFDLIVSNSVEDEKPCSDENRLTVAHVPVATASTVETAEYQRFYLPELSDKYRYVSFEKFQNNPFGLLIADVRVYVRDEDMPFSFEEYMNPVWEGDIVYNESITFIPDAGTGEIMSVPLLYEPTDVISVKSYDLSNEYTEGVDYIVKDGKIYLPQTSRIKPWTYDDFYSTNPGYYKIAWIEPEGRYIHYDGGDYHERKQYYVTYRHNGEWNGVVPEYAGDFLPQTVQKLEDGEKLRVLFYGDSITAGGETSGCGLLATEESGVGNSYSPRYNPYMSVYPKLVSENLRRHYPDCDIEYINTSGPGWSSKSAADCAQWNVYPYKADLLVVAYGMNDLSYTADAHKANILSIIDGALEANPDTEFILVATILPNVGSAWSNNHYVEFKTAYEEIREERSNAKIAIAPMTEIHQHLLSRKRDADMSANGINHPNDFLSRVYAQTLSAMLIKNDK